MAVTSRVVLQPNPNFDITSPVAKACDLGAFLSSLSAGKEMMTIGQVKRGSANASSPLVFAAC